MTGDKQIYNAGDISKGNEHKGTVSGGDTFYNNRCHPPGIGRYFPADMHVVAPEDVDINIHF